MPRDNNFLTRRNIYFPNACMVCVLSLMIAAYNVSWRNHMFGMSKTSDMNDLLPRGQKFEVCTEMLFYQPLFARQVIFCRHRRPALRIRLFNGICQRPFRMLNKITSR